MKRKESSVKNVKFTFQSLVIYKEHQEKNITHMLWKVLEFKACTESNICAVYITKHVNGGKIHGNAHFGGLNHLCMFSLLKTVLFDVHFSVFLLKKMLTLY